MKVIQALLVAIASIIICIALLTFAAMTGGWYMYLVYPVIILVFWGASKIVKNIQKK